MALCRTCPGTKYTTLGYPEVVLRGTGIIGRFSHRFDSKWGGAGRGMWVQFLRFTAFCPVHYQLSEKASTLKERILFLE